MKFLLQGENHEIFHKILELFSYYMVELGLPWGLVQVGIMGKGGQWEEWSSVSMETIHIWILGRSLYSFPCSEFFNGCW